MDNKLFHPLGLIVRKGPDDAHRFAMRDPASAREVQLGGDWHAAYERWLDVRCASFVVPNQPRVKWMITEFGVRHRPAEKKERSVFNKEIHLLVQAMQDIGDPLVADLDEGSCRTFRNVTRVGPVKTETLVRRLRQIWRWACAEGLTDRVCPWVARNQEDAIRAEVIDIVTHHLPESIRQSIDSIVARRHSGARDELGFVRRSLFVAVREAARSASYQMQRDGRPDLLLAIRRCDLEWFLEARALKPAGDGHAGAELLVGHARIERVRDLGTKVRAKKKKITLESDASGDDVR
jgi:hypothetical protein